MSRLVPLVVSPALLALLACEEILSPEYEPAELVLMITTGYLGVEPDTIQITMDQRLRFWNGKPTAVTYPTPTPIAPDVVSVIRSQRRPEIFQCIRGGPPRPPRQFGDPPPGWDGPLRCDELEATDSLMLLTTELRETAKRIMPCAGELTPETFGSGFGECIAFGGGRVGDLGPGLVNVPALGCGATCMEPVACGWTWATYTKLDGRRQPWPLPFDGSARVEVEIVC